MTAFWKLLSLLLISGVDDFCSGEKEQEVGSDEKAVFSSRKTQDVCSEISSAILDHQFEYANGSGKIISCPSTHVATYACGATRIGNLFFSLQDFGCPNQEIHGLRCTAFSNGALSPVSGPETDWLGTSASTSAWAFCPDETPVITSRCDSFSIAPFILDCELPQVYYQGIKCRRLSRRFYMKDEVLYGCGSLEPTCPYGYFATGSCSSSDCSQYGCSGILASQRALQCTKWGYLADLDWDFSEEPFYEYEILNDINPVIGAIADLDVSFESRASASASASFNFDLEFGAQGGIEANLLSLFGFPSIRGLFGGGDDDEFVELDLSAEAAAESTFQAAAEAQASASIQSHFFSYAVSLLDGWSENFVRLVYYRRKQIKRVTGTVRCCNCDRPETTVSTEFETSMTGYLALHIKDYPRFDLEQISAKEFVELYLSGQIVDFSGNPFRGFISSQSFFKRLRIFIRSLFDSLWNFIF